MSESTDEAFLRNIRIAELLISQFAENRHLIISRIEANGDGLFVDISKQKGLNFDLHLTLTNADEFGIAFEDFSSTFFPFPANESQVVELLDGIHSGEVGMMKFGRGQRPLKLKLVRRRTGTVKTLYTYFPRPSFPFFLNRIGEIRNNPEH
ncbi:MAG: hypothetical protein R3265_03500 [Hyphomonas sp.]|nr:hypothetical protein [Hyphomonas sp.]